MNRHVILFDLNSIFLVLYELVAYWTFSVLLWYQCALFAHELTTKKHTFWRNKLCVAYCALETFRMVVITSSKYEGFLAWLVTCFA